MNRYGKTRAWLLIGTLAACVLASPSGAQKSPESSSPPPASPGKTAGTTGSGNTASKISGTTSDTAGTPSNTAAKSSPSAGMQIRKDAPGEFTVQFLPRGAAPTAPMPLPSPSGTEKIIALSIPADIKPAGAQLQVIDTEHGNVARLPVATTGVTPLTESSFTLVQDVRVPVQSKGQGVTGVQVTLSDASGKYRQSVLLLPADNGVAAFRYVPLGIPITVTVQQGAHPPISQTETLTRDHPADGYRRQPIALDWPDVKTVPAPATAAGGIGTAGTPTATSPQSSAPVAPAQSGGGFLNSVASMIVSLLFLGAIGYGFYYAYTTGRLKTFFDKLGIQTAPLTDAGTVAPNPFTKPERAPIQPITEGTADPFGGSTPVGDGAAAGYAAPNAGPRLVATMGTYAGNIFPLAAPRVDIGRDAANAVPLPQDTNASRRHATIEAAGGQVSVIDNNSSNGTFVNGVRILTQTPHPLHPGDEVQIGQTRFRFEA